MLSSKIRTGFITAVAALSVVSLGPTTSVASARKPVKVGHIEIYCQLPTAAGAVAEFPEGTVATATNPKTGETRTYKCMSGQWVQIAQEAPPIKEEPKAPNPSTSQERPSIPPVLAP